MRGTVFVLSSALLFVLGSPIGASIAEPRSQAAPPEEIVPLEWLDKQISVEQAEADNLVQGLPFGAMNDRWKLLKASLQPGDALWTYCSSWESFKALAGRCGIALVRNGKVVNALVTMMN
jgi:hypothetical protein